MSEGSQVPKVTPPPPIGIRYCGPILLKTIWPFFGRAAFAILTIFNILQNHPPSNTVKRPFQAVTNYE